MAVLSMIVDKPTSKGWLELVVADDGVSSVPVPAVGETLSLTLPPVVPADPGRLGMSVELASGWYTKSFVVDDDSADAVG